MLIWPQNMATYLFGNMQQAVFNLLSQIKWLQIFLYQIFLNPSSRKLMI